MTTSGRAASGIRVTHHAALGHDRREIIEREHGVHAWQAERGDFRNTADRRVRVGTAHEARVQDTGHHDVVDETALPAQQRRIFKTRDP